ncbi:MAG TPA: hypothetical protein PLE60_14855 [Candidatus Latescibacteria bacterium]|nr:hypothetical protein [Candidatus Latescibacterota bacterium]
MSRKEDEITLDELKRTRWWALWVAETGGSEPYKEAIDLALSTTQVFYIEKSDCLGEPLWFICDRPMEAEDGAFAMSAFPTRKEAVALCREMGWKITK